MSKTKVTLSGSQITEKWSRRMKNSVSDIQIGIDNVTVSPMEKAVAKQDKMLQNLTKAIQDGRWAAGMRAVSLDQWKSVTKQKVANSLAAGVDNAQAKRSAFDNWLVTSVNAGLSKIANMPDMTFEDSMNRVREFAKHMSDNKYRK